MAISPAELKELWALGSLGYKLHAGQKPIRKAIRDLPVNVREALIFCSRRYGKSFLAAVMAIEDCIRKPKSQVFIIGPSIKQTTGIVNGLIPKIIEDAPDGLMRQIKSEKVWHFSNGSKLIIGGFDNALESSRGMHADAIYLEESGLSDPDHYDYTLKSVLFPMMQHSRGKMIHLTTPALTIDHPLHTDTIPKTEANGAFFKFTIRDNPLLTEAQIEEEILNLGGLESSHCQRELFCNIVRDELTTVVPQFRSDIHVVDLSPPADSHFWVSGDIGGTRDKTVFLLWAYDYGLDKLVVVDEVVCDKQTPTPTLIAEALKMEAGRSVYRAIDAAGQTLIDLSAQYGYPSFLPEKLKFDTNILRVQSAFWKNEVVVHPRCKFLIATLNSGQLNKQRTDFARTEALGHCDALAALVYGLRHADRRVPRRKPGPRDDTFSRVKAPEDQLIESLKGLSWTSETVDTGQLFPSRA